MVKLKNTEGLSEDEINAKANAKSEKRKAARDRLLENKTVEKGLLIVHTGTGKGKSTAAFGLVTRAIGNDMKVGVIQFVKGKWETGERVVLEAFPDQVKIQTMGEGFTWETRDRARDQHGDDHAPVSGAGAHHDAAGERRRNRRQEVRAHVDVPPQAAQHGGRQLRPADREQVRV